MPKNTPIQANTIDEARLAPHLRHRTSISPTNITYLQTTSVVSEKYQAGVAIAIGELVYLDITDGLLKKADNSSNAAEYIAITSGNANTFIEVKKFGLYEINLSFSNNTILFLGTNGQLTDTPPSTTNYIYQPIGIYNDAKLKFNISEYYILE